MIVLKEYILKKEYITKPDADIVLVYQIMSNPALDDQLNALVTTLLIVVRKAFA